jgi:hypothetical protein
MEKVTLTKLYEVLAQKVGRNEAECLAQYVEIKVKDELNTKTEILATKVLVKDETLSLRLAVKEDIHALRNEVTADIHALRNEVTADIHALRNEVTGDIHALRNEVTTGIHTLRNEMKEHSLSQQKWMLSIFITVVIMIMGLYATILFKH